MIRDNSCKTFRYPMMMFDVTMATWDRKPSKFDYKTIHDNMRHIGMTIDEMSLYLNNKGIYNPGYYDGDRAVKADWKGAWSIAIEFDNDEDDKELYTIEEFMTTCKQMNIIPNIIYETFSSTAEIPRWRAVWFFEYPIGDIRVYEAMFDMFLEIFPHADSNAMRATQLFNGTDKNVEVLTYEPTAPHMFFVMFQEEHFVTSSDKKERKKEARRFNQWMIERHILSFVYSTQNDMDYIQGAWVDSLSRFPFEKDSQMEIMGYFQSIFRAFKNCSNNQSNEKWFEQLEIQNKNITLLGDGDCFVTVTVSSLDGDKVVPHISNIYIPISIIHKVNDKITRKYDFVITVSKSPYGDFLFTYSIISPVITSDIKRAYRDRSSLPSSASVLVGINRTSNRNTRWTSDSIIQSGKCPLYNHFMSREPTQPRIRQSDRMIIITNSIGATQDGSCERMSDGMVQLESRMATNLDDEPGDNTYNKWNRDIKYVLGVSNPERIKPWSCNHCSYASVCPSMRIHRGNDGTIPSNVNMLSVTKRYTSNNALVYYHPEGNPYPLPHKGLSVEESHIMMANTIHDIKESDDTHLHLLLCDTGVGKTHAMLESGNLDGYILCFPTHKLKEEIFKRWNPGSSTHPWFQPTPPDLSDTSYSYLLDLYRAKKVDVLSIYLSISRSDDINIPDELKRKCREYYHDIRRSREERAYESATTIICTHDYFYYTFMGEHSVKLPSHFHTIIFDEDFNNTRIKSESVDEYNIRMLLDFIINDYLPHCLPEYTSKVSSIYEYIRHFQMRDHRERNTIIDCIELRRKYTLDDEVILDIIRRYIDKYKYPATFDVLFYADEIMICQHWRKRYVYFQGVYGYRFDKFPRKVVVMSATASPSTYRSVFRDNLRVYDFRGTDLQGVIRSFPQRSYSKSFMGNEAAQPAIKEMLMSYNGYVDGLLSHKAMYTLLDEYAEEDESFKLSYGMEGNFGGLIGLDHMKGKNILIVGTQTPPIEYAILLDRFNGGDSIPDDINPVVKPYDIRMGDYYVRMYLSSSHPRIQDILVGHAESQCIQSIGRARLVREDADVFVQSRIVPPGAIVYDYPYWALVPEEER